MVMECNREEAVKAKALAESKYENGDVKGAHRMAVRAQAMYPALQGIKHLVAALEVLVAASARDWYSLLQVSPCADAALIKKQYHKLALLLHPDKSNAAPASEAFKLLYHAFRILSDSSRRAAYDLRQRQQQQQPPPPKSANPAAATAKNPNRFSSSFCSSEIPTQQQHQQNTHGRKQKDSTVEIPKQGPDGKKKDSESAEIPQKEGNPDPAAVKDSKNGSKSAAAGGATWAKWAPESPGCFWTYCPVCKTPQEQPKCVMNLSVLCIHCLQQFQAFQFGSASIAAKNQQPKQQRRGVVPRSNANANADAAATKAEGGNNSNINSTAPPQQQHHPKTPQEKSAFAVTNAAAASFQNQNQHPWQWIPRQNAGTAPKSQSYSTNGYINCSSNVGPPQRPQQHHPKAAQEKCAFAANNAAAAAASVENLNQYSWEQIFRQNANAAPKSQRCSTNGYINCSSNMHPPPPQQHPKAAQGKQHPKEAPEKSASATTNAAAAVFVQSQSQHPWEWIPRQNVSVIPKSQSCATNGYINSSSNIGLSQKPQQHHPKAAQEKSASAAATNAAAASVQNQSQYAWEWILRENASAAPKSQSCNTNGYIDPFMVPPSAGEFMVPPYRQFGIPQFTVPAFPVAPAYVTLKSNRPFDNQQFACGFNNFANLPPKEETAAVPTSESMPRDRPKVPSQENPSCSDNGADVQHNSSSSSPPSSFQPLKRHGEDPVYKPTVDKKNEVSSFRSETQQNVVSEKISMGKENLVPPVKSVASDPSTKQDKAASKEESIDKKNQDPRAMSASTDAPRSNGQDEAGAETEGEKKQQQRQEENKKPMAKRGVDQFKFDRSAFDRLFGRDNVMKKAKHSTK